MTAHPALTFLDDAAAQRLHAAAPSGLLDHLAHTRGLRTEQDAHALLVLIRSDLPAAEIVHWSRLGPLHLACRLVNLDQSPQQVARYPLAAGTDQPGLAGVLGMLQAARAHGLPVRDAHAWVTGGLLRLDPPHVDAVAFATWRRAAALHLGWTAAALACAAGMTAQEAISQHDAGRLDVAGLRLLAALSGAS
jgi:hypothetical protein